MRMLVGRLGHGLLKIGRPVVPLARRRALDIAPHTDRNRGDPFPLRWLVPEQPRRLARRGAPPSRFFSRRPENVDSCAQSTLSLCYCASLDPLLLPPQPDADARRRTRSHFARHLPWPTPAHLAHLIQISCTPAAHIFFFTLRPTTYMCAQKRLVLSSTASTNKQPGRPP